VWTIVPNRIDVYDLLVMRISWPARLVIIGVAVSLTALGVTGGSPLRAFGADRPASAAVTSYSVTGQLFDVTDVSSTNAWAVGFTGSFTAPKTLILHWNGQKWSPVTSPKPITGGLLGLSTVSATNIWAAGFAGSFAGAITPLVMHWNGKAWSRVPGVPSLNAQFNVVGQAGTTLLAVGALSGPPMLIMERIGTTWKRFPVPSAAGDLESIAVTGARSAWAVGVTVNPSTGAPIGDVLMRWNGSTWHSASFPLHGTNENLWHLAVGPHSALWAVGDSHNSAGTSFTPISMVFNGASWRKVAVPAPANSGLSGVAFVPGGTALAGGSSGNGKRTLIVQWTGTAWRQVATPNPYAGRDYINSVAAASAHDAWAVGVGGAGTVANKTLILHWNGAAWH